jgi:hypothetical protein
MKKPNTPSFVGWGMTSTHALPWDIESSTDKIPEKKEEVIPPVVEPPVEAKKEDAKEAEIQADAGIKMILHKNGII